MYQEKLYLITYDDPFYPNGEPAEIMSVVRLKGTRLLLHEKDTSKVYVFGKEPTICYVIKYQNGKEDFIPKERADSQLWHLVTLKEIITYGKP